MAMYVSVITFISPNCKTIFKERPNCVSVKFNNGETRICIFVGRGRLLAPRHPLTKRSFRAESMVKKCTDQNEDDLAILHRLICALPPSAVADLL